MPHSAAALLSVIGVALSALLCRPVATHAGIGCFDNSACDDGNACTTDRCNFEVCHHLAKNCNDLYPCTTDTCDPDIGCVNTPNPCLTTTTYPPPAQGCGDPNEDGLVSAGDALASLRAATGTGNDCTLCKCDVTGEGTVTATDALLILKYSVKSQVFLDCPPC